MDSSSRDWLSIPILPCVHIDETMEFWQVLGFTQTYYQNRPYQYGVVERNGYSLHFSRIKGLQPEQVYSSCLITVTDIDTVYEAFTKSLKTHLGRVPRSGFPRISRMKTGQSRFTLTDPSGNSVIFIKLNNEGEEASDDTHIVKEDMTRLQKAIANTIQFRDFKNDDDGAMKILDVALKNIDNEQPADIAQALLMRIELADVAEDTARADDCYAQLKVIQLTAEEIETVRQKTRWESEISHLFADAQE